MTLSIEKIKSVIVGPYFDEKEILFSEIANRAAEVGTSVSKIIWKDGKTSWAKSWASWDGFNWNCVHIEVGSKTIWQHPKHLELGKAHRILLN